MTNFNASQAEQVIGLRHRDIDLSSARDNVLITFPGATRLYVAQDAFDDETTLSSALSVGYAFFRMGSSTESPVIMKKGRAYAISPVSEIFVTNPAQASKMMRVYYSTGDVILPFASEIEIVGDIPAAQTPGTDFSIANGAAGNIAANADRKEAFVVADGTLRLSGVTGKGFEWDGSQMVVTSKGQIDFFNDSGATVNVKFTEFSA